MLRREPEPDAAIADAVARWLVRRDRGLSATEAIEFELWLAADARHATALREQGEAWFSLDRIPDRFAQRMLAAASRRRRFWRGARIGGGLATAAAVLVAGAFFLRAPHPSGSTATLAALSVAAGPRALTLDDGTVVRLNVGGEIVARFTAEERHVQLIRGEAHFTVTKNPARPFVVHAAHVGVRAVGTAFSVVLHSVAVEVLVTEGVVRLDPYAAANSPTVAPVATLPLLNSGHRAVIVLHPASPEVAVAIAVVNAEEIAHALAWQAPLLRLDGATLSELGADFERRTGRRVILADPTLGALRIGGRVHADDVEGFTSLLGTMLDIEVVPAADGALVLRKKNQIRDNGNR